MTVFIFAAIVFGTPMAIVEGVYKKKVKKGLDPEAPH
jgi:hypothetical protein